MSRFTRSSFIFFVILLMTACGGTDSPDSLTAPPTRSQSTLIYPTETPILSQPTQAIPTSTATALPALEPTVIPGFEEPGLLQFPDPAQSKWQLILSGLRSPIGLANAGDGSGRLFVVEQAGRVRVINDRELLGEPFLDISDRVSCCGERGLLGLAFHPQYLENGFFFVNYTDLNGDTVIARFDVSDDRDRADPNSELKLMVVEQPYANHNGGGIAFGPDGYLYIALGDGGSGGDPLGNAQNTNSLLGKLLRIDVNQPDGYAVPADNPYAEGGGAPEVWAYGLRNPWRFSFDREAGHLYIGDVGQGSLEEIDFLPVGNPGGANFGWNFREGSQLFLSAPVADDLELIAPAAEYGRDQGYSVIGGLVYRGEQLPDFYGIYLYGDYGSGFIWGLIPEDDGSWKNRLLFQTGSSITSFGEDESGELYFVAQGGGLYQLVND